MNRRSFLRRTIGAIAAAPLLPLLSASIARPVAPAMTNKQLGVSVRMMQSFDPSRGVISRMDVLYGMPSNCELACRVVA